MNPTESQQYNLGQQAHEHGYRAEDCPLPVLLIHRRAFWLGGWHDRDMEQGNRRYFIEC